MLKVLDVYSWLVGQAVACVGGGGMLGGGFTKAALLAATDLSLNGQKVPAAYI